MNTEVRAWQEEVLIPTYPIGLPEKNPMFLEKRVYQGSSGVVYPYPIIEKIGDEKTDVAYTAVFLENRYIKIMILPGLGGRIQMAFDKIRQRHFIYHNRVIRPALVGLTGPWISGGIEFNWPQHHRPSTFLPVDFLIRENPDGSKTVWVNEVERMFRTKGMAGYTLYPDKAFIEIRGQLYNRTPFPQTFLWWANPAVKVNEHYQSVFPPDVYAVYDHGKRDVSEFPVARGVYYKVDYAPGTDISWYKNIPVPTSYMVISSRYDFIGGYEHDSGAGLLHVADHLVSPGKKLWTWGTGEFGQAWEKNLTDEDGPYMELMTGVYTDNQPDFSWLQPGEEKTFIQYFMPYRDIGMVKNASKDALLGLEIAGSQVEIKLFVTSPFEGIRVDLVKNDRKLYSETIAIGPESPYIKKVTLSENIRPDEVKVVITDVRTGREILSYQEETGGEIQVPSPARAPARPRDVENNEQLYLTGMHLEQYRHATFQAQDYYEEALKRDPGDIRNNNALGLWYLRRGRFEKAESCFRKAIATLTSRNPNPYDGEPFYSLGWALRLQNRHKEAFNAFYKCVWSDAWQHAGYLNLARIAVQQKDYVQALELIGKSLIRNVHSHTARHLKAVILRYLDRITEAGPWIEESLDLDPFNFGCLYEKYLLLQGKREGTAEQVMAHLRATSRNGIHNFLEYALDYAHAGLFQDASGLLSINCEDQKDEYALVPYYLGWFAFLDGNTIAAREYFQKGAALAPDYIFPNRVEEILILKTVISLNPDDSKAYYYLGNLWYDKRQYDEAIPCWEKSVALKADFPTVHRNLGLACYNKLKDPDRARASMETAFSLDTDDARVLMELDQLYKRLNKPHHERLTLLEKHLHLVLQRDDLYLERITLYNQLLDFQKARDLLAQYRFHPWEGGEGKVVGQYLICHLELAKQALAGGRTQEAFDLLNQAEKYPASLGEGKLFGAQENDIHYLKGIACERMARHEMARQHFERATSGISEPVQAFFYNDPQPDKIFYQGLTWRKLSQPEKAEAIFHRLVTFGEKHLNDDTAIDYFAVSLPDLLVWDTDLNVRNKIHCLYMMGLGYLGLDNGQSGKAEELFDRVLDMDINHQGAQIHRLMMNNPDLF
ncbi:MAG: DUF5107 domain-containing protein [Bacteroidales bacterium]|nr:DUF5107 domain-containing protein [Lentimicrobiaceae bacterium]MDD5694389.1 DUF5107 domain-containing protein [Bacteroidales bacterium]